MISNREKRRLLAEGMREKARVYIGRNGITERIHRLYDEAWIGTCVRPYPVNLIRVHVQYGCTMTPREVVDEIERRHPGSECVGMRDRDIIFRRENV